MFINKFVILSVLLATEVTPQQLSISTRVLGGSSTTIDRYPVVAQLLLDSWGTQQFVQHCAALILTSRHLLSVAHCFQYNENVMRNYSHPKYWKVRVGSSFRSQGGYIRNLKTIIPHPEFDRYYYVNDIAVLVVDKKFIFNTNVAAGTISKYKSEVKPNSYCTLIGWGFTESGGHQAEHLQQANLYTIDQDVCRLRYNNLGAAIMNSMICAGKLDVGEIDACFGDSGGPLIYKGVVIGLVSFGYDCGNSYYPGVYTKISHFTDWILKMVAKYK